MAMFPVKRCWLASVALMTSSLLYVALPAGAQQSGDRNEERTIEYWVGQLNHDQFLRREMATKKLTEAGADAVAVVVKVLWSGDLETTERAIRILSEIALRQLPTEDGGAWGELNDVAGRAAGSQSARATAAVEEIRNHRNKQAQAALDAAGVFVGVDDFVIRATSQPRLVVQIDEKWRGEIEPLHWLRWLKDVEYARVKGPAVRRDVLQQLVQLPNLKTIALVDGTVDDETLAPLKSMRRIDSLELRYVPLTSELADSIVEMPIRVSLNLMGTGVAAEKVVAMREALPGLRIDHKQGGFLGVTCQDGFNVCQINSILPDSAADRAGLIAGDIIVGIDDTKVERFRDLQEAINQHLPGDEVVVKFSRGGDINKITLQLGKLKDQ